jgi:hypothetical protein
LRNRGEGVAGWRKRKDLTSGPGQSVRGEREKGKWAGGGHAGPEGGRKGAGPRKLLGRGLERKGRGEGREGWGFCFFLKYFFKISKV